MGEVELVLGLLVAVVLLAQLAWLLKVPYPIVLVLGGLAIGLVPGVPDLEVEPDLIFLIFLPPLLQAAAWYSSPRDLYRHLRPIGQLALGLVLATAGAVALIAHLVIGLPWAAAFVLGAIVAPTDPVAAEAIFRRLGVPGDVQTIVSGESLVNDGSALVAYQVAVAAVVTGAFSLAEAGLNFLLVAGGGVLLGLLIARAMAPIWMRIRDASVFIVTSVVTGYLVYLAALALNLSGILAVVAAGLYLGWRSPEMGSATSRLQAVAFWDVFVFLLNALLFVLVGLEFPRILDALSERLPSEVVLGYAGLVAGTVIVVRLAWLNTVPFLHGGLNRILPSTYERAPWRDRLVIGWSGMRGAVSLAAALALPLEAGAGPFPARELIILLTFAVILATLVLQGLTLPALVRRLGVEEGDESDRAETRARVEAARAALDRFDSICSEERVPEASRDRMRERYEGRIERLTRRLASSDGAAADERSEAWRAWRQELISAEREAVVELRNRGDITPEVMRRIERDLDLEESRIGG